MYRIAATGTCIDMAVGASLGISFIAGTKANGRICYRRLRRMHRKIKYACAIASIGSCKHIGVCSGSCVAGIVIPFTNGPADC